MEKAKYSDVLIVGGGAAGIAAAVAAARNGMKVTLVEHHAYPGGKATAAEVGTVCGLYKFSKAEKPAYIVKSFTKDFAEALQKASGSRVLNNGEGLHYLPYNVAVFKDTCLALLNEHKVEVYFNASLEKMEMRGNSISSASIRSDDNAIQYSFKSIVDCSGDSIISKSLNLPLIKSNQYQAAAQVFTIQNIAEDNENKLGMILMRSLRLAIDNNKLPDFYDRVYIVQGSLKNNSVSLKIGIPVAVTYKEGNLEAIKSSATDFVETLFAFLKGNVGVFKNASVQHVASEPGIRVGLRTEGRYILTEEDVLSCRKFEDAIANGAWPVEEWEQDKRVKMRYFALDDFYQVPAGCLRSKLIENLFMAGRNISAQTAAIASARVMGICLQTGYAAGWLAAGYASDTPEELSIKAYKTSNYSIFA